MPVKISLLLMLFTCSAVCSATGQDSLLLLPPSGLMCDLIENTQVSFQDGYPTNIPLAEADKASRELQYVVIRNRQPYFGWIVNDSKQDVVQTAYRVLVSSDKACLEMNDANMWDSGKVDGDNSVAVRYEGAPLDSNTVYYWKVKVWNNDEEESDFSPAAGFCTGKTLKDHATPRYPLQKTNEYPVAIRKLADKLWLVDFGKAAFGQLSLNLVCKNENDTVEIHLGEALTTDQRVNRAPGGTIRYQAYQLPLLEGEHHYKIQFRPDARNTGPSAIKMPAYIGEVMPFRYCEIEGYASPLHPEDVERQAVHYPFNEEASYFNSSDSVLNAIWDLCKYSVKATSFAGVYVDGDRERIPYEADAYINQLCHYSLDREYSMARYSQEYLITHPSWPTEWILQSVLMAWNDYLYTGNIASARAYYQDLKAKTLMQLAGENDLISTWNKKLNRSVLQAIHFKGSAIKDIVDWPHSGILGLGKKEKGETDGFVFRDVNTVVNAYYYRALTLMSRLAEALGEKKDGNMFADAARKVKRRFNHDLLDKKKGIYVDGIGTRHSSLHANFFPLAFGLVPDEYIPSVLGFIKTRGMACSVYGAQFLLDAIYEAGDADYGLSLLNSTAERSWYNMIRAGSTISMEAWDNKYKPNQDWNHAWGAAPANIIPRKLMGIEPVEPGYKKVRIKPQPGNLQYASIKVPTIRGDITMRFDHKANQDFTLQVEIPANTLAEVCLPDLFDEKSVVTMDDEQVRTKRENGFFIINKVGSGKHVFRLSEK